MYRLVSNREIPIDLPVNVTDGVMHLLPLTQQKMIVKSSQHYLDSLGLLSKKDQLNSRMTKYTQTVIISTLKKQIFIIASNMIDVPASVKTI